MIRPRRIALLAGPACLGALLAAIAVAEDGAGLSDLGVVPSEDGFLTTWLALGPLPEKGEIPPPGSAREGDRLAGGTWTAIAQPARGVKLRSDRAGVAFLAAVLHADRPRRVHLATGSDVGLRVLLNGRELLRRDEGRRAQPDTDLVRLDLAAGDNPLVLELSKSRRGAWTVYARLLDGQYRSPWDLDVVLPGAGARGAKLLAASARLAFERTVNLDDASAFARLWLEFPGGRPVLEGVTATVAFQGPGSPAKAEVALPLERSGAPSEILAELALVKDAPTSVAVSVAGAKLTARVGVRMPIVRKIAEARRLLDTAPEGSPVPRAAIETAEYLVEEVRSLVEEGDEDNRYLGAEADRALRYAREISAGRDPLAGLRGRIERLGYRSSVDGALHPYGLYVPPGWREEGERRFGLVVALHGLNSFPMKTLTTLFGVPLGEDESKLERERRPLPVGAAPMFALAPEGFGNSNYFGYGEQDVLEAIGRVSERYRIDPDRVYVTGASMGGTGAAALPLHFPDRFAAAAPLCGYHSVFEYDSIRGQALEPWERSAAARRSNVSWAENGRHLPLHVVHGTQDSPRSSEVLVNRYRQLGYDVAFETPVAGHNVWDETYENRWIFDHFRPLVRASHPRRVTFATGRLRYAGAYWIRVDDLGDSAAFARVDATWREDGTIAVKAENARGLTILADAVLAAKGSLRFELDGEAIAPFAPEGGEWRFHRVAGRWERGAEPCAGPGPCKRAGSSGPIDDVWYEPLVFVYGTADPDEAALGRRLAQALAVPRAGLTLRPRIKADVEIGASDIEGSSLVLIGTPAGNSLLARIQGSLPIRAVPGAIEAGPSRFEGETVAAAFVYPNPLNPARYVLVYTGASREALFYADHLPELLPDWVVYDASSWQTKGGIILGGRKVLAAGFFDRAWRIAGAPGR